MSKLSELWRRMMFFLRRGQFHRDLNEEMRLHQDLRAQEHVESGMPPEEAQYAAKREFGNALLLREKSQDIWGWRWIEELFQDLRFGLRQLRRNPGFTAVAVVTLALGIGANTAIFSVVNTVLLRPLPYRDADRLVTVWEYNRVRSIHHTETVSAPDFADWRAENHVFQSMGASTDGALYTLTGSGQPLAVMGYYFSADFFHVLGTAPLIGRTFLPEEEQPGKNHVVVLSYSLWQNQFGGDRAVLGKTITLDEAPYTVVGVMPPGFKWPGGTELWTPLTISPKAAADRSYRNLRVMARLKPGVTVQQARVEMNMIARRLAVEYPKTNKDESSTEIITLRQKISGDIRPALLVLMCAVGLVLLIACVNVANLLLARAANRQKEVAVRAALGASRGRLIRQFLTESMLLALAGGALGLLLAFWSTGALVAMFPPTISNLSIPHIQKIPIDGWVLGFALAVSILTGVVFGLVPALQTARLNTSESLKESGRSLSGSTQGRHFRNTLVISEVALSLILVAAAALTIESFAHLLGGDLGFSPDHVLTLRVLLPKHKYGADAGLRAFSDQALDRIRALPSVKSAGTVTFLPLSGWEGIRQVSLEGQLASQRGNPNAVWSSVTPGYFRGMGIPLIKGRFFTDQDNQGANSVAIISKRLARRLAPNRDPVGQHLNVEGIKGLVEIVGVVGDVHQLGITSQITSEIYLPFSQVPAPIICFAIRTTGNPTSLAREAQRAIWAVDKDQAVSYVMSMDALASESLAPQRVVMALLGIFAAIALLLAAIGLYGVISYSVARRTHEIGIRMALGAQKRDVLRLVLSQGIILALIGVGIGIVGAFGLTRFLSSLLYGVKPTDPLTFVLVSLILIAVALLACYVPARRAMKIDPMEALRYE
ncbi:MAG TPA: ABC transporter permease [Terriglobia bacterium]|nr:ABC transporter permease [Terriglobia bacterium]